MPIWEEIPGQTWDRLEGLHPSAGLGTSSYPPGGVGGGSLGEKCLGFLFREGICCPSAFDPDKQMKLSTSSYLIIEK